jgi:5-methyltetrahydropteroyltriglutamate--homocysteine methyltransferase
MTTIHNLESSRIDVKRILKLIVKKCWKKDISAKRLENTCAVLCERHWDNQKGLDLVPVGGFFFL